MSISMILMLPAYIAVEDLLCSIILLNNSDLLDLLDLFPCIYLFLSGLPEEDKVQLWKQLATPLAI